MISASQALSELRAGNQRFLNGSTPVHMVTTLEQRQNHTAGQAPFAVVLGCSDSRVPVELIFDQGPGNLFVIRVAGNIVAPSLIGSVEFAATEFGTRLVVVLGHSGCGAVGATLSALQNQQSSGSPHLHSIVERIRPAVEPLLAQQVPETGTVLMKQAVRANIRASVEHLRSESAILQRFMEHDGLRVVGAQYAIDTGEVDFFDGCAGLCL